MNIISMVKNMFRDEPVKSFTKAGILDEKGDLTNGGAQVLLQYLLEKNKDAFNTDVVQPLLKEQEKLNSNIV